jgi:hypothetical protein
MRRLGTFLTRLWIALSLLWFVPVRIGTYYDIQRGLNDLSPEAMTWLLFGPPLVLLIVGGAFYWVVAALFERH